jgi:hypothetical protein
MTLNGNIGDCIVSDIERTERMDVPLETSRDDSKQTVRERELARQAFVRFSMVFGLETSQDSIDRIAALSEREVRIARRALETTVRFFGNDESIAEDNIIPLTPMLATEGNSETHASLLIEEKKVLLSKEVLDRNELSEAAVKFLKATGYYDESLTLFDIPRVAEIIVKEHGPSSSKLDYEKLIRLYLLGVSKIAIAEELGSTIASISQTIYNFKNKIIENNKMNDQADKTTIKDIASPVISQPVKPQLPEPSTATQPLPQPKPQPFKLNPIELPVVSEKTEAVSKPLKGTQSEWYEKLKQSLDSDDEVSHEEWQQVAEACVKDAAERYLYDDQIDALWAHLHRGEDADDDNATYKSAPRKYREAIEELRPLYERAMSDRINQNDVNRIVLVTLFDKATGLKNLDDVHARLYKRSSIWTKELVERRVVLTMAELMRSK